MEVLVMGEGTEGKGKGTKVKITLSLDPKVYDLLVRTKADLKSGGRRDATMSGIVDELVLDRFETPRLLRVLPTRGGDG